MNSGFKYDVSTNTFLPDISELTLFCEGKKVGTCTVDLASYIDKQASVETVYMSEVGSNHNALTQKALYGDHVNFPGSFLKFRINVQSPVKTASNISPSSSGTNQLSKRSTQSVNIKSGFQEAERLE